MRPIVVWLERERRRGEPEADVIVGADEGAHHEIADREQPGQALVGEMRERAHEAANRASPRRRALARQGAAKKARPAANGADPDERQPPAAVIGENRRPSPDHAAERRAGD